MPIIRPEIFITPDCPTVKFREEPENINLAIEIPKILASQGWGLGTIFTVQFVDHDRTKLIKFAKFVVSTENSSIQTFNPDGPQPMTKLVEAREAKQTEPWFYPNKVEDKVPSERSVKWNFGQKKFHVMHGDNILSSFDTKEEAEKYRDAA